MDESLEEEGCRGKVIREIVEIKGSKVRERERDGAGSGSGSGAGAGAGTARQGGRERENV